MSAKMPFGDCRALFLLLLLLFFFLSPDEEVWLAKSNGFFNFLSAFYVIFEVLIGWTVWPLEGVKVTK